jgi:hypothetical protein
MPGFQEARARRKFLRQRDREQRERRARKTVTPAEHQDWLRRKAEAQARIEELLASSRALTAKLGHRCTSAERDACAAILNKNFAIGCLDAQEVNDRLGKCVAAVVWTDLRALIADLPGAPQTQTQVTAPQPPPEQRCDRADRDRVADVLQQAFAAGALDADEINDRLSRCLAAKFPSELMTLVRDLPRAHEE